MHTSVKIGSISVLIPDGETWDAVKVLRCLSYVSGITTHVLAKTRLPLARVSRYCSSYHYHTSENDDDWIRMIRSIVQSLRIDVVLPVTEKGVELVARNRTAVSEFVAIPPLADFKLIMMVQDKWSFHRFAVRNGFPVPASVLIGKAGETSVASLDPDSVDYPALLKPTMVDGGFGILKVKKPSDLAYAWSNGRIMKGYHYLLQSYIPGTVACLAIYSQGGEIIAYTLWKTLLTSRRRLYYSARAMEYFNDQSLITLSKRLIATMKWDGIANIDFLIDSNDSSVKILDFNPRLGQSILGSLVAGVNFPLLACLGAMGLEYPKMQQQESIRYAHPATQSRMLVLKFTGRQLPVKVRWKHGSLQFTVRDPLPELVDTFRRIVQQFQRRNPVKR
jgi:predicted ATP-grasp superfamily ATP-dependent carboligase